MNPVARVARMRRRRVKSYYDWVRRWVTSSPFQYYFPAYWELLEGSRKSHLAFYAHLYSDFISVVYRFILMKVAVFRLSWSLP